MGDSFLAMRIKKLFIWIVGLLNVLCSVHEGISFMTYRAVCTRPSKNISCLDSKTNSYS